MIRFLPPLLLLWSLAVAPASANEKIRIASVAGVTADSIAALIPEGRRQGLDIEVVEFTDWTLPNEAVQNGDADLNYFQHQAFLDNAIKQRGYTLSNVGLGILQNIGIYSARYRDLSHLPPKAKVAIASDVVNQGRSLLLLQKAGLITLATGDKDGAGIHDISANPRQLQFHEVEGPQILRSLPDVDLGILWPSHFVQAGQADQAGRALLYSGIGDTFYAMSFVARSDKAHTPAIRKFVQLYQNSDKVRQVIDDKFNNDAKLYVLPWQEAAR